VPANISTGSDLAETAVINSMLRPAAKLRTGARPPVRPGNTNSGCPACPLRHFINGEPNCDLPERVQAGVRKGDVMRLPWSAWPTPSPSTNSPPASSPTRPAPHLRRHRTKFPRPSRRAP